MKYSFKQLPSLFVWPALAFTVLLLLSILIYTFLRDKINQRNEKQFTALANQARERLIRRLDQCILILKGSQGLYSSSAEVSRNQWRNYVNAFDIRKNYPGIQGIGYAEIIKAPELPAHITRLRNQGFPAYTVYPAGPRNVYTAIIYLEPFTHRNKRALGFDMYSDPVRRQAMEKARDTGKPILTPKVRLIQETTKNAQPGFLIYLPVYKNSILPQSIVDRRRQIKGFVYAPFLAYDIMRNIFRTDYNEINIKIFDGTKTDPAFLLYDKKHSNPNRGGEADQEPKFTSLTHIHVGGRNWTMQVTANPEFGETGGVLPDLVLIGGILISFLSGLFLWSVINNRRSNQLKQIIMDNATGALFMIDKQGYCTFMNPAAISMTGYTLTEIRQKPLHDMIHHHHPDGNPFPIEECPLYGLLAARKNIKAYEDVFIRKDGTYFNVSCAISPIMENGVPVSSVLELRDITEELKTKIELQESEARFRNMADSAPVIIWINDEHGMTTYLNRQWFEFTHLDENESVLRGWQQSFHPDDLEKVHAAYQSGFARKTQFQVDYRLRRHDGVYRWMAATANPRFDAHNSFKGYIGSIIDITERKEAEQRLKENADLLHEIFLKVPAIVSIIRASDLVYILANPLFRELHGNRPLIGRSIREANPEMEKQGYFAQIEKVIKTGKPFVKKEVPITFDNANKPYVGYFNLVFQPLYTKENQLIAVLLFSVEVTELVVSRQQLQKINAELSRTNIELRRTNTDLDNFVYTASHDLKAPIANLEGLTYDLKHTLAGRIKAEEEYLINLLSTSIDNLKRTINDLSDITKVQKQIDDAAEVLEFTDILQDVQTDLENHIKASEAKIILNLEVTQLKYTRKNLRSILYNLLSNAIKYRSPNRALRVQIATAMAGNEICLSVTDNGLGIRPDQHHKLFTMFKRIHTHVEGSGIGLYIVKRIVENYGGRIEMESQVDAGTTFRIFFKKQ